MSNISDMGPLSRKELYLAYMAGMDVVPPEPSTRAEMLLNEAQPANAGATPVIEALNVSENGTYTAPDGVDGYSPVTVNVPSPDLVESTVAPDFSNGDMVIEPPAEGKVLSKVTIQKPETLVPENVAEGVDIGGIVGTLAAGLPVKIASGTFTGVTADTTIEHGLGVVPDFICVWPNVSQISSYKTNAIYELFGFSVNFAKQLGITRIRSKQYMNGNAVQFTSDTSSIIYNNATYNSSYNMLYGATESSFIVPANTGLNTTMRWLAIGGLT